MSRHTNIPPFARQHGANHPAVQSKILAEIEEDVRNNPAIEERIGYIDADGILHLYDKESVAQEQRAEAEEDKRIAAQFKLQFLDILAVASLMAIVVLLGVGLGLWVMQ